MARKKQETLVLFPEVYTNAVKMTDTQFGQLMRAVFAYRFTGSSYEGEDLAVDVAFRTVAGQIDRYAEVCEINGNNRRGKEQETKSNEIQGNYVECSGGQQNTSPIPNPNPFPVPNPSEDNKADKPPARSRFSPPSIEDVRAYCKEQGYTAVDPQRFVDYYESNGWMVGKNKMKDWKATVRGWNSREQGKAAPVPKKRLPFPEVPTL